MNRERDQNKNNQRVIDQPHKEKGTRRSNAFDKSSPENEKSTARVDEEAELEQERKEAMTERD